MGAGRKMVWLIRVLAGIALLLAGGCIPFERGTETPAREQGGAGYGNLDGLAFENPELEARLTRLDTCLDEVLDEGDWIRTGYEELGNFYERRWCRGDGAREDCTLTSGGMRSEPGQQVELFTLSYKMPEVFGLGFSALSIPEKDGWGNLIYYSEGGRSVIGDGFSMKFFQRGKDGGATGEALVLGGGYGYRVAETEFQQKSTLGVRDEIQVYLNSAESMKAQALKQMDALEEKARAALLAHEVPGCNWMKSERESIPPRCEPRAMTTVEEQAAIKEMEMYFQQQRASLETNYLEMYQVMMEAFPFTKCWDN